MTLFGEKAGTTPAVIATQCERVQVLAVCRHPWELAVQATVLTADGEACTWNISSVDDPRLGALPASARAEIISALHSLVAIASTPKPADDVDVGNWDA